MFNFTQVRYFRLTMFFLIGGITAIQPELGENGVAFVTIALAILGVIKSFFPSQPKEKSGMIDTTEAK